MSNENGLTELERSIREARRLVNRGVAVDANYALLRTYQQQAAAYLVANAGAGEPLRVAISALRLLHRNDFADGTLIRCGHYLIRCAQQKTTALDVRTGQRVKAGSMPQYLYGFVF